MAQYNRQSAPCTHSDERINGISRGAYREARAKNQIQRLIDGILHQHRNKSLTHAKGPRGRRRAGDGDASQLAPGYRSGSRRFRT
jgi:hypothetical protein